MVPSGSARETGVGMGAVKFYEDGTRHQFEFEIGYWDENNDILSLEFDYRTPGLDQEKIAYYRQGEFDKFYEVSLIHLDGKNSLYFEEELIFEFNSTWSPNYFHFFAFNDQREALQYLCQRCEGFSSRHSESSTHYTIHTSLVLCAKPRMDVDSKKCLPLFLRCQFK